MGAELPLVVNSPLQHLDEMFVDLDRVELVAGKKLAENLLGDRAGARADFENTAGRARLAEFSDQSACQEATARQDRAGSAEVPPKLTEKVSALRPVPH